MLVGLISLRLCGGPSNFVNSPSADEKSAAFYDSEIAIFDEMESRPGSGIVRGESEVTVGIMTMCPRWAQVFDVNSATDHLKLRIDSDNDLRLGKSSGHIFTPGNNFYGEVLASACRATRGRALTGTACHN